MTDVEIQQELRKVLQLLNQEISAEQESTHQTFGNTIRRDRLWTVRAMLFQAQNKLLEKDVDDLSLIKESMR